MNRKNNIINCKSNKTAVWAAGCGGFVFLSLSIETPIGHFFFGNTDSTHKKHLPPG